MGVVLWSLVIDRWWGLYTSECVHPCNTRHDVLVVGIQDFTDHIHLDNIVPLSDRADDLPMCTLLE